MESAEEFPMPVESERHALQCALDTGEHGLWLGTMNKEHPLLRYNSNPYFAHRWNLPPMRSAPLLGANREMANYQERWRIYFEILDGNKSNSIDPGDAFYSNKVFAKLLGVAEDDPKVKAAIIAFTKLEFDVNKDSKVTLQELLSGVEAKFIKTKSASALPAWWKANAEQFFKILDKNSNGELSEEEVVAAVQGVNPQADKTEIIAARQWAIQEGGSGKYDADTYSKLMYLWATAPGPTPQASLLLPQLSHK